VRPSLTAFEVERHQGDLTPGLCTLVVVELKYPARHRATERPRIASACRSPLCISVSIESLRWERGRRPTSYIQSKWMSKCCSLREVESWWACQRPQSPSPPAPPPPPCSTSYTARWVLNGWLDAAVLRFDWRSGLFVCQTGGRSQPASRERARKPIYSNLADPPAVSEPTRDQGVVCAGSESRLHPGRRGGSAGSGGRGGRDSPDQRWIRFYRCVDM
jgi:hypothetical protein